MRQNVFETDRLVVQTAAPGDEQFFLHLWRDPRVMSNVGFPQGLRITEAEIRAKLEDQNRSDDIFRRWLVIVLKETGEIVGECMMQRPDEGIAKTDVKLLPDYWGNKYGVEIKRGLLDYLFTHTECLAVEASPNVKNIASIKMQEAVGGVRIKEMVHAFPEEMRDYTVPVHAVIYRVYREAWENNTSAPENK